MGAFLRGEHILDSGWGMSFEGSFTRGLNGPNRGDRSTRYFSEFEPQFAGRVALHPSDTLEIGTSGLLTWFEEGNRHRRLDLIGVDLLWRTPSSYLRAEYLEGGVERGPLTGGDFRRKGWYAEVYHQFLIDRPWIEAIEMVVRYDSVDENSRVRDFRDVDRWAFGCNWLPNSSVRFKLQYEYNNERGRDFANDGYLAQLEYHF